MSLLESQLGVTAETSQARIPRWLAAASARRPDHPAAIARSVAGEAGAEESGGAVTYRELESIACLRAGQLAALGARSGGRIAVLLQSPRHALELIHAAMAIPCTLMPLHPRLLAAELAPLLAEARPDLLVFDSEVAPVAEEAARASGMHAVAFRTLAATEPAATFAPCDEIPAEMDHCILYTSGTTGRPKGARLSYRAQLASARASAARLGQEPHDRWLLCMPLCHIGGLAVVLRSAIYATTVVLERGFDPAAVAACLARDAITHVSLVPTMLARLLDERPDFVSPPALRCVLVGGAGVDPAVHRDACARGFPLAATYGLTEAASQVATAPPSARSEPGGVPPLPGVEIRIVDADGKDLESDAPGEILVRAPQLMSGYLDRPEESARALHDGWLHTGDYGCLDAHGYLRVLDRRSDLIVTGGENVYPAEVESVLLAHPRVREAAVVGLPDPAWGHAVTAAVVAGASSPEDTGDLAGALRAHCAERLAAFKRPKRIVVVDTLPRTSTGKLQRELVRRYLTNS